MTPGGPGVTGFNPYAYVGQNPTTLTDPSGRMADTEYSGVGMVGTAAAPALAGVGLAVNALLLRAIIALLVPTVAGCAAGIACPIDLPWDPGVHAPDREGTAAEEAISRRAALAGEYLSAVQLQQVVRACRAENIPAQLGEPEQRACTGEVHPIFVSGGWYGNGPILDATTHDFVAIMVLRKPAVLTRNGVDYGTWWNTVECSATKDKIDCDEYPFNKTAQGGGVGGHVSPVTAGENRRQGNALGYFYQDCRVGVGPATSVPVP